MRADTGAVRHPFSNGKRVFAVLCSAVILAALVFLPWEIPRVELAWENLMLAMHPSAELAFEYAERHFDASHPSQYDITRADYLFAKAVSMDPTLPYLFHERARIAFLRGDFSDALAEINYQILMHGDQTPNSYYIRGLIEGYMGRYNDAIADYKHFLAFDTNDWAAMNDYAWVLLKAGDHDEALRVTARGTSIFPNNAWLLNSLSIAQSESGNLDDALASAHRAVAASQMVTEADWLHAYPGNDPKIAAAGVASLRQAALDNMHSLELAVASSTVQYTHAH